MRSNKGHPSSSTPHGMLPYHVLRHPRLRQTLRASITPAGALAFIVASNLYIPCIASISVLRSELGSWGRTLALLAAMFALAMGMACAVYHIAVFV